MEIEEELKTMFLDGDKKQSAFAGRILNYIADLKQRSNKHPDDNSNNRTARKLEMHKIRTQNPEYAISRYNPAVHEDSSEK